jgi:valyl-tRNA synthetase
MNDNAGAYAGMDRFAARKLILEHLAELGFLEKTEPHKLSAGHCYRCHTITEPYLSKQWFVRMQPLAEPAIAAVRDGKIKFHPERWTKVYLNWMENIRDWCISRQIWWGHRLPVYYCRKCLPNAGDEGRGTPDEGRDTREAQGIIVSRTKVQQCPACGSNDIYQDEDVLDTWFSSWLWPFATFYWPDPKSAQELGYFYPTSTLVTAPEIIFFWVARMIMAGLEFMGDVPFRDVYIHGTVRDIEGKKMSKSLGNVIDPLEIIADYGADALRFSLISITAQGQDVFLAKERFEQGRNFANKVWNASRFIMMNLDLRHAAVDLCVFFKTENLGLVDRWILSRFYSVLEEVNTSLGAYKFNEAANCMYGFFWHELCDWYLEITKPNIADRHHQVVVFKVLEKTLRMLHPFMPFVTEEIWHRLNPEGASIMVAPWPHVQEQLIDREAERRMGTLIGIIKAIRNLRLEIEIKPDQPVAVSLSPHSLGTRQLVVDHKDYIINLARLERLDVLENTHRPQHTTSDYFEDTDIYLHFAGLLDAAKERKKIEQKLSQESKRKEAKKKLLENNDFIGKANRDIVEKMREELAAIEHTLERLEKIHHELS